MAVSERRKERGRAEARRVRLSVGRELREARLAAGLSQRTVARVAGLSQSRVSRIERAQDAPPDVQELAILCAVLGLSLSLKAYPQGSPVRDAAQLRLLERFRARLGPFFRWRTEAPIGGRGDLRAWDMRLDGPGSIGVDAETRIHDLQAVQRRSETKRRDSGVDRVILLVARTHHNTTVLREHRLALASTFPAGTGETMAALRRGRLPTRDGIVVL